MESSQENLYVDIGAKRLINKRSNNVLIKNKNYKVRSKRCFALHPLDNIFQFKMSVSNVMLYL